MKSVAFDRFQYDQWSLRGPCEVGLMSHSHEDHDPTLLDSMWTPEIVFTAESHGVSDPSAALSRAVTERRGRHISSGCLAWPLGKVGVAAVLCRESSEEPRHAVWWLIRCGAQKALFVGELDAPEVEVLKAVVEKVKPDVLMLPIYGDIDSREGKERHRCETASELREKIDAFASEWAGLGVGEAWALPHVPLPKPSWAARMAEKLPRRRAPRA